MICWQLTALLEEVAGAGEPSIVVEPRTIGDRSPVGY